MLVSVGCSSYRFLDHSAGQGSGNGIETRIFRITGTPDLVSVLGRSRYRFSDQPAGTQQRERIGGGEAEERRGGVHQEEEAEERPLQLYQERTRGRRRPDPPAICSRCRSQQTNQNTLGDRILWTLQLIHVSIRRNKKQYHMDRETIIAGSTFTLILDP